MAGELFIVSNTKKDLISFGKRIFDLLSVSLSETRSSENVAGGSYLTGSALGLKLVVEKADHQNFQEYHFLLYFIPMIRTEANKRHNFDDFADTIAGFLARDGMKIARPIDFGREGTPSVIYIPA